MSVQQAVPHAWELGLVSGLAPKELRQIYRDLARRYHPDSGVDGSEEIMRHINALHDQLKAEMAHCTPQEGPIAPPPPRDPCWKRPTPEAASVSRGGPVPKPKPAPPAEPAAPRSMRAEVTARPTSRPASRMRAPEADPDAPRSLGELALTSEARELLSDALIQALDRWLVQTRGVPRNALRRRMMVRLGRIDPVSCPGLHMPDRISMTSEALHFHFGSEPVEGPNLVALPQLSNDGLRLAPTGEVAVLEEILESGQDRLTLSAEAAEAQGFSLRFKGRPLAVELEFDREKGDFSAGLYSVPPRRFRGLFMPASDAS